ncbi:DUF3883 domain-containing protein [Synechococcus sp. 1G10]|uniref:DUF3883 domain-containing protein n=1 Tax=Synechococcus sp. 1G10 TaxID=2025605 RepID=UPI000B97E962|nr:DUF3883 domain-containing protein [Synechococcus sp. 1G10]
MGTLIKDLSERFLAEGRSAPMLFRDLAKLETYLAESYKTRSLIELIQNADDAEASSFGIHEAPGGFAVGNTGRIFSATDVEALCRSGASNKYRGGLTIGYRGIGFKSVVNLANTIFVYSGEHEFCFNKERTISELGIEIDVPLIRIPHEIESRSRQELDTYVEDIKHSFGYATVFIFTSLNKRLSQNELSNFDAGSLLFLNHLRHFSIQNGDLARNISISQGQQKDNTGLSLTITEGEKSDTWYVFSSPSSTFTKIAARMSSNKIVSADFSESVFHSFTPSEDFTGALLKINGDYSTDPSRKRLDMDDRSRESFNDAVELLADLIHQILECQREIPGFFQPLADSQKYPRSAEHCIIKALAQRLLSSESNKHPYLSVYRLRPKWLNYDDYELVCRADLKAVSREHIGSYPELISFFEQINIPVLSLEEVIQRINKSCLSELGYEQLVSRLIKQYRYDLTSDRASFLKGLVLWPTSAGIVTAGELGSSKSLERGFMDYLTNNNDSADVTFFMSKLDIECIQPESSSIMRNPLLSSGLASHQSSMTGASNPVTEDLPNGMKSKPRIQRWRTAEQNAEEYLQSLVGVKSVTDMSRANLGYDLELLLDNGERLYVEVKSVKSFSEPFRLTNNEYNTAHQHKGVYALAIVVEAEPFQINLILNPVESLALHKQCEKWSWKCEDYQRQLCQPCDMVSSFLAVRADERAE